MRTLTLIRHAKSSWEFEVSDQKRPLTKLGIEDANLVSNKLKDNFNEKYSVFISNSLRTLETAKIFIDNDVLSEKNAEICNELYTFHYDDLLNFIQNTSKTIENLVIFGHNHALTDFFNNHTEDFTENIPSCGVVQIKFDCKNWNEIKLGTVQLFLTPKSLKI
jgi:phosphohistidine phosphatase